jgi:hypothetical protein
MKFEGCMGRMGGGRGAFRVLVEDMRKIGNFKT